MALKRRSPSHDLNLAIPSPNCLRNRSHPDSALDDSGPSNDRDLSDGDASRTEHYEGTAEGSPTLLDHLIECKKDYFDIEERLKEAIEENQLQETRVNNFKSRVKCLEATIQRDTERSNKLLQHQKKRCDTLSNQLRESKAKNEELISQHKAEMKAKEDFCSKIVLNMRFDFDERIKAAEDARREAKNALNRCERAMDVEITNLRRDRQEQLDEVTDSFRRQLFELQDRHSTEMRAKEEEWKRKLAELEYEQKMVAIPASSPNISVVLPSAAMAYT